MQPTLETPHLWLTPLRLEDAEQVQPLFATWDVVQFLNGGVPWPFPGDGVQSYYRDHALPATERGDEWHWMLRLKEAPEQIIGSIGIMRGENNRGFWLARAFHGRGLMTEAAECTMDFAFERLGFERLRAPKAVGNVASRRVSEKTGMRCILTREDEFVCGRTASEVWEITREQWAERRLQEQTDRALSR